MFEREVLIAGIRHQCELLRGLVDELEQYSKLKDQEYRFAREGLKRVEGNLRKLRAIGPAILVS
jgi:hypothetical protein